MRAASGPTVAQASVDLVDPHDCTDDPDKLAILEAVHLALVRRGADGRWEPALAERWSVSDDARVWTFELKPGVECHDGTPADAEAAAWSIARMARPDIGATLGAPAVWAEYLAGTRIEAVSRSVVRIALDRPMADLLDILGSGYVLSPGSREGRPVGCGAYRIETYDAGHLLDLQADPSRPCGRMANSRLRFVQVGPPAERAAALEAGAVQAATRLESDVASIAADPTLTLVEHLLPTAIIYLFNATRGPVRDSRVRRALNLALDRGALVAGVLGGGGRPLNGFVSPVHLGAANPSGIAGADLESARHLLAEAGYRSGLELEVACPTSLPDEAEALTAAAAAQLAPLGVTFRVERVEDRVEYANRVRLKRIGDLCVFDSSPMSTFRVLHEKIDSRVAGSWWQGYRNRQVEALVDRARSTVADGQREAIYRECYRLLQEDPPWLYLYNHTRFAGLAGNHPDWRMRADGVMDVCGLPAM